ncbi:hypothetical protein [Streptomyces erythrochromogenes]|uniref:hypothetical protein n=1 Tax=Streptomyces erythrochromogenes TaxID=285574 RepID=UPI00368F6598
MPVVLPGGACGLAPVDDGGGRHLVSAAVAVRVSGEIKVAAEEIDGVALEAEPYMGVDRGGDVDMGAARSRAVDGRRLWKPMRLSLARGANQDPGM